MTEQENNNEQNAAKTNDEKMAVEFPEWDLLPPDVLIKRSKNEN